MCVVTGDIGAAGVTVGVRGVRHKPHAAAIDTVRASARPPVLVSAAAAATAGAIFGTIAVTANLPAVRVFRNGVERAVNVLRYLAAHGVAAVAVDTAVAAVVGGRLRQNMRTQRIWIKRNKFSQ